MPSSPHFHLDISNLFLTAAFATRNRLSKWIRFPHTSFLREQVNGGFPKKSGNGPGWRARGVQETQSFRYLIFLQSRCSERTSCFCPVRRLHCCRTPFSLPQRAGRANSARCAGPSNLENHPTRLVVLYFPTPRRGRNQLFECKYREKQTNRHGPMSAKEHFALFFQQRPKTKALRSQR